MGKKWKREQEKEQQPEPLEPPHTPAPFQRPQPERLVPRLAWRQNTMQPWRYSR